MANSEGIITAPVRLMQDVQPVLGIGGGIGDVITNGQIEPWAKYKPVKRNKLSALTEADRAAANYGLVPKATAVATTAPHELFQHYNGDMNGWVYDKPRGGIYEEWFRLLDFDGYTANPDKPIRNYSAAPAIQIDALPTTVPMASFTGMIKTNSKSIELAEIQKILSDNASQPENIYFGLALFKGSGQAPTASTPCEIKTSPNPIAKNSQGIYGGCSVDFDISNFPGSMKGLWTAIPFFAKTAISQRGIWSGGQANAKFYTIPYAGISTVNFFDHTDTYTVSWDAVANLALFLTITFKNNTNAPITLDATVYYWDARDTRNPELSPVQGDEKYVSKTGIVVPANGTYDWLLSRYSPSLDFVQNAIGYIKVGGDPIIRFNFDRTPQPYV